MKRSAAAESGFTLIEMLVALVIFSLLSAAGVGLLRSSVDLQEVVQQRLGAMGEVSRFDALLASDLGQALNRPTRARDGVRPAFTGSSTSFELVAGGSADLDNGPRSDLRRVRWAAQSGGFVRTFFPAVDGSDTGAAPATLAREIDGVGFRYRLADGTWRENFSSTPAEPLPVAVEVTVRPRSGPPLELLYALSPPAIENSSDSIRSLET